MTDTAVDHSARGRRPDFTGRGTGQEQSRLGRAVRPGWDRRRSGQPFAFRPRRRRPPRPRGEGAFRDKAIALTGSIKFLLTDSLACGNEMNDPHLQPKPAPFPI